MARQAGETDTNQDRARISLLSSVLGFVKSLLLIALIPASFIAVFLSLFFYLSEFRFKQSVSDEVPNMFPVLVLTPGEQDGQLRGHYVYYKYLDEFLQEHPEHTFLVPEESEEAIRAQLNEEDRHNRGDVDWESPHPWNGWFRIEQREPGRQRLKVSATWDDDRLNIGWYEATDQAFTPAEYKFFFGPGVVMLCFFTAGAITVFLWIVVALLLWQRRRLRRKRMKEDITLFDGIANTQERTPARDQR